jgi:hypothetical protein
MDLPCNQTRSDQTNVPYLPILVEQVTQNLLKALKADYSEETVIYNPVVY